MKKRLSAFLPLLALPLLATAQQPMNMSGNASSFVEEIQSHTSTGTSAEPNSTPTPMIMTMRGNWMLMFHANAFIVDTQQSSSRGRDKFFSTNWFMPMAQRPWGPGQLTLRAMFSLEPATVTGRGYPLLFQQGETAFGHPITDGQHPHDFLMELAALYDWPLGNQTLLSFYAAPVGDPAIGPTAYPHRSSALEDPVAALGHHQEDSTHISDDVVTLGLTHKIARIELSGFHGREPNEHRWQVQQGGIDSWATRLTLQPGNNWSGQYSYAFIHSLEQSFPRVDQRRTTASVMYNRPFRNSAAGDWSSSALWGRTRTGPANTVQNSYLFESLVRFAVRNHAYTRIEDVDRTTELLLDGGPAPPNFDEKPAGRVQAYTFGYDRDVGLAPHLSSALGVQITAYTVGSRLEPIYGSDPVGVSLFLRLRPSSAPAQ
ncbi:MAG TPA: hypothetical protein VFW25_08470 [Silvibacterium sp.]|nr:hypothetical protein [Silvibacterium sp.]